mmetsp:Transcript_12074/g.16889  ORF Transcript_12074/g.16889 Transcript_12074/m.16889 type:complete len:112 (+) Transcript_12074:50-385(+)
MSVFDLEQTIEITKLCCTPKKNWVVAAGIRSTGLTGSLGIGRHVTQLLKSVLPNPEPKKTIKTTPLPNVQELVAEYQFRGDGMVTIHGNLYRVTHPITIFGWEKQTGIAKI